jgi:hypothetical protein
MKVLVWLSINDAEATASKVVEVLPGTGLTIPNGLPVREHAWTVWRAAYYWALIQRTEGYAAAMAALDRKEEPRL